MLYAKCRLTLVNKYLQLFRIGNCLMGAVGIILGMLIAVGSDITDYLTQLLLGCLTVIFFIIGGNTLNDYLDRDLDKFAHPERPLPSGKIKPQVALNISISTFIIACAISVFLGSIPFIITIVAAAVMIAYELKTKKLGLIGNLSIAWLTSALFFLGGAITGHIEVTIPMGAMAFLATLGREIVKDVQDMAADFNRTTLPKQIGKRNASLLSSIIFVVAVILSFEPYLTGRFGLAYLVAVFFADAIFIYSAVILHQNPERGQKFAKYGMFVALIAFLLGGLL